jgi:hypothetical protein
VRRRVEFDRPDAVSAAWESFWRRARRRARHWEGCEACPPERRDPGALVHVHHVIPQQRLKQYASEHHLDQRQLLELLTDARNGLVVCERCHHGDTSRMEPIRREAIHEEAWSFARDLGLEDYVKDRYP